MSECGVVIGGLDETSPIMNVDGYTPWPWNYGIGENELRIIIEKLEQSIEEERLRQALEKEIGREQCNNYDPVYTVE